MNRKHSDQLLVGLLTSALSLAAFLYYFRTGQVLLYGDAVAHLNIARRVVDSLTPGPLQLGTVWLPLPHLLMLPLVWLDKLWQSGIAGSLPSMVAYVAASVGVFRLTHQIASRSAGWIAVLVFAGNPNLIYMQATAMTETIFLAAVIWAVAFFAEYSQAAQEGDEESARVALYRCAGALSAAILTRYDGWFLTAFVVVAAVGVVVRNGSEARRKLMRPVRNFVLLVGIAPAMWLAYNQAVYGNPLEFANGPYSARAIEERSSQQGSPHHPGYHSVSTAALFFVKSAKLNMAGSGNWEFVLLSLAITGAIGAVVRNKMRPALLLWVALPFYMLSISYGGVPIFIPPWWPHSYYNVRYGLQLLPAIAVFVGAAYELLRELFENTSMRAGIVFLLISAIGGSYWSAWKEVPICLREARVNSVTRISFENALASQLQHLRIDARLMMYTGDHIGALQRAGIPLRHVLNEGNYLQWQNGLQSPAQAADYVIAIEGDPVADAVAKHSEGLRPMVRVVTPGKPAAVIYESSRQ